MLAETCLEIKSFAVQRRIYYSRSMRCTLGRKRYENKNKYITFLFILLLLIKYNSDINRNI